MHNKELWDRVKMTDPSAVKPITGKPYKGSSPKPYWLIERATDEFGPCGTGWGVEIISERFERMTETDLLHVAQVRVWYVIDGKRGEIYAELQNILAEDLPVINLFEMEFLTVYNQKLKDHTVSAMGAYGSFDRAYLEE